MKTYGDLIDRNALHYPNLDAYVMGDRRFTWREYAERVRRLSSSLERLGINRQDRLGILSTNTIEYYELYGVCEWAGYIAAPYNFRLAPPEVAWLLQDSAPHIVFFETDYTDLIDSLRHQFPGITHYVCIGGDTPDWAIAYNTLIEDGDPQGGSLRAQPGDEVYLYYTSGTTGRPKGVPHNQEGALYSAMTQGRAIGPDMRVLQITPAFHIGGKGFAQAAAWMAGTVVLHRAFDPLALLETVQKERITFTFMVAPMIQAVLDHPRFDEFDLSSLRQVMSASAAIPVPLLRRAIDKIGPVFFISYGSTETATICLLERHELQPDGDADAVRRLGSVGHFVPEIDAVLLNDDGEPCQQGEVGEVCVCTPIFHGYWNNSAATIDALRHGYFHTGDLGMADEQGFIFLVDRKKDMIISGGENIYSREVEEALYRHEAVRDAAVIGVPDEKWGEAVKAVIVLGDGASATENDLIEFCRTQIARYKCPRSIAFVEALPVLGSGKIDKVTLRKQYRPA
jgi:acyl-CoA synthetase (AMP-forming)/AMP-acid ligase II